MTILALVHFFAFLSYAGMIAFILHKNSRALLNRVCALFLFCFVIWSFGAIFISDPAFSKKTVKLAMDIYCIGWCGFAGFSLWFHLVLTKKEKILKNKGTYFLIFLPAIFFIYKQWTGGMIVDYLKQPYGWSYVWSETVWRLLFYAYYSFCMLFGLYLCLRFSRKTGRLQEKKQAKAILIATSISFTVGSLNNVLQQELNIHSIPPLADVSCLIWLGGLVYAVTRYGLMTITPAAAAEDILATMADSLILITPNKHIIRANNATLDLLGYKENELIGKPIDTVLNDSSLIQSEEFETLIKEGRIRDYDMEYKTKSGEIIPMSFSASAMYDQEKQMVGIVGVGKDLRQIKQLIKALQEERTELDIRVKQRTVELEKANRELRDAQARLIQSAKMAAVGQLGAGVAHELNNPLGGILGYAQFILERLRRPEFNIDDFKALSNYIESIEREANRCKVIVENLLRFSRKSISVNSEPLDITQALNETLSIIGHQLELKNIKVVLDLEPKLSLVAGIANQLQQVFANIILNAQQSMPETGELKITAQNVIDVNTQAPAYVRIDFSDTGCGISEENIVHIFEPFFTTKQNEKGTGLGLAISYQIIQDHNGNIEVRSQIGKGTTVTITLPTINESRPGLKASKLTH